MVTVRVAQFSDTHFLEDGAEPEGGVAYDTDAAWRAVRAHLGDRPLDLVAVTGDVADHGRPAQYHRAAAAFAELSAPVNVCPGNHDLARHYDVHLARPGIGTSRLLRAGAWAFLFVDSCDGLAHPDDGGGWTDPPGEQRLHSNGSLGPREAAWVRRVCAETDAEHVFVWLHHPPDVPVPLSHDETYAAEWRAVVDDCPGIRGFGGGHSHVPDAYEFAGRPVFVAPSLKNNFSLEPQRWLPPGYRTYEFAPDGTIDAEVHLVDDDRWPRRPFGRAMRALFDGELSYAELAEITARKAAEQRG